MTETKALTTAINRLADALEAYVAELKAQSPVTGRVYSYPNTTVNPGDSWSSWQARGFGPCVITASEVAKAAEILAKSAKDGMSALTALEQEECQN